MDGRPGGEDIEETCGSHRVPERSLERGARGRTSAEDPAYDARLSLVICGGARTVENKRTHLIGPDARLLKRGSHRTLEAQPFGVGSRRMVRVARLPKTEQSDAVPARHKTLMRSDQNRGRTFGDNRPVTSHLKRAARCPRRCT